MKTCINHLQLLMLYHSWWKMDFVLIIPEDLDNIWMHIWSWDINQNCIIVSFQIANQLKQLETGPSKLSLVNRMCIILLHEKAHCKSCFIKTELVKETPQRGCNFSIIKSTFLKTKNVSRLNRTSFQGILFWCKNFSWRAMTTC